jgi:hypothetical protein
MVITIAVLRIEGNNGLLPPTPGIKGLMFVIANHQTSFSIDKRKQTQTRFTISPAGMNI